VEPVVNVIFTLSNKVTVQNRDVYNIWMVFSEVGGVHALMRFSFAAFFGFLSRKLVKAELM